MRTADKRRLWFAQERRLLRIFVESRESVTTQGTFGDCDVGKVELIEHSRGVTEEPYSAAYRIGVNQRPVLLKEIDDFEPVVAALNWQFSVGRAGRVALPPSPAFDDRSGGAAVAAEGHPRIAAVSKHPVCKSVCGLRKFPLKSTVNPDCRCDRAATPVVRFFRDDSLLFLRLNWSSRCARPKRVDRDERSCDRIPG
jgi:hypothetical protein